MVEAETSYGQAMQLSEATKAITPTVEIICGSNGRATGWGWGCSCGDGQAPRIRKKQAVLGEARHHFDTKHGGMH
jgi:hypothetical protein